MLRFSMIVSSAIVLKESWVQLTERTDSTVIKLDREDTDGI